MRAKLLLLLFLAPFSAYSQSNIATLPAGPIPGPVLFASTGTGQSSSPAPEQQKQASSPLLGQGVPTTPITRTEAETLAVKNNPRITADRLLALEAGPVTRNALSRDSSDQ
jgi:outer membrane protein